MKSGKLLLMSAFLSLSLGMSQAAIKMEIVAYKQDTASLEGILVYDSAIKGKKPGILLAPDWMGITDIARQQAEKTAKLGYVVFVADIYGKNVRPKNPGEAGKQAGIYKQNRDLMRARAHAALSQLLSSSRVDTSNIAAMGYCFGGGVVLELARSGANLKGAASFHGSLDTPHPEDAKNIKGRILIMHGADDPYVSSADVQGFMTEMKQAGVDWNFIYYSGAVHAFTIPAAGNDNSKGAAYNANADKRSWSAYKEFLTEIFPTASK